MALDTCTYGIPANKPATKSKKRTKLKGIKASFQSDKECSYIGIEITKDSLEVRNTLKKLVNIMQKWEYIQGEYCDWDDMDVVPELSLFTDSEHTIKKLKDDYKHALIEALN